MSELTQEEALEKMNTLGFPEVQEGDIASQWGYDFIYQSGEWVIRDE